MRLRRLELQGFKSFLDRTILTFEPGVTGVVGPNGCGKSNIVDAILWVMGEQSPKHLRGESMTDIIFAGSDSRAATSMAEVSLVMDRQGVALAPQFAAFNTAEEISITRRIYRDGTGEFLINKTPCRLKDIHELFMDTGVGRRAYSIIEQGQIDRMINVKPEDRRFLFEEVAGITKYKTKRKEAERKLELTRTNITRLVDIIAELEKQIRSLKIQATKARKFKEIKGELEVVDLYLLGRNLHSHEKLISELGAKRDELIALRSESEALFAQVDAEVTELEITRIDQEKEYQKLGDRERDVALAVQRFESQISIFEERRKFIVQSAEALVREAAETEAKEAALVEEEQGQIEERAALEMQLEEIDREVSTSEESLRESQGEKQRLAQRKNQLQQSISQLSQKEFSLDSQRSHGERREAEIREAAEGLQEKTRAQLEIISNQKESLSGMDGKISDCASRSQQAENDAQNVHSEVQTTSRKLSEQEEELFRLRETYHSKKSRLQSLTELQENLEGYSPTAKEILGQLAGTGISAIPLAEVLQPEAGLEDLFEMLLGADMNTLLVKTTDEAHRLAQIIEKDSLERVRIAALSEIEKPSVTDIPNCAKLAGAVKVTPGYEAVADRWIANGFLCGNEEELLQLRTQYPGVTLLSRETRVISHADGSLTSGTLQTRVGVFARRREIDELSTLIAELEAQLEALTRSREELLKQLESQESLHEEIKTRLSQLHIESVEYRKEREKMQADLNRAERDQNALADDIRRNEAQLAQIVQQMEEWAEALTVIREEKATATEEAAEVEAAISTMSEKFDQLMVAINEKKIERSKLGERTHSIRYRLEKISAEMSTLQHRRRSVLAQKEQEEAELVKIADESVEVGKEKEQFIVERNELMVKISDVKQAFNETCQKLQDLKVNKDELQDKRENVLEELQQIEIKLTQQQSQFEQIRSISVERYQREPQAIGEEVRLELEKIPMLAGQLDVTWELLMINEQETLLQEHLKNLKDKVDRYGEVNLTAIQEFEEIQKRYDFLLAQKNDLENSIKILEEAILKIDESTKQRFEETFEAVNRKFREIFPILFNGGKAELTLTNPENLLESGVDVMVQPPGKRLQSITLLSGGEKALTAVSLILAIFARKPSPFCLLDEVDAPLDDANVSRFNTVIRKMSEKTQFIVITHNKKTMEIAEALYGVTMEKAGVSKMTSVRLN